LTLVTKQLEAERLDGYDGAFRGVASKSVEIVVSGGSAQQLFEFMKSQSVVLPDSWMKDFA
jgi:hypothetical protein